MSVSKDRLKGQWKQLKAEMKQHWAALTDQDLKEIDGERERLAGRLQERYGLEKEAAADAVREFERRRSRH